MTDGTESPSRHRRRGRRRGGAVATQTPQAVVPADEHGGHPDVKQYVLIAVVLVIVTGSRSRPRTSTPRHTNLIIIALGAMAIVKFFLVDRLVHAHEDRPPALPPLLRRRDHPRVHRVRRSCSLVFSSTVLKS